MSWDTEKVYCSQHPHQVRTYGKQQLKMNLELSAQKLTPAKNSGVSNPTFDFHPM